MEETMRWLYELCRNLWSVPAPAAARRPHPYRPRIDLLEGREAPASPYSDFISEPLPPVAAVGESIPLYLQVEDSEQVNNDIINATIFWGDGSETMTTLAFAREDQNTGNGVYTTQNIPAHSYGPSSQGSTRVVTVFLDDGTTVLGPVQVGAVSIPAAVASSPVSPSGNTTGDFLLFAVKTSFSSSSGNTKISMLMLNASGQTINGPFFVALGGLKHSVKLSNETGISKVTAPGDPFLYVPGDQLAAWQGASFTLNFHSSTGSKVSPTSFQPMVFAGTGVF
jgi:hypothetical protein